MRTSGSGRPLPPMDFEIALLDEGVRPDLREARSHYPWSDRTKSACGTVFRLRGREHSTGIVLGARVPIILTSRADSVRPNVPYR
jgi:hypothetical protein